MVLRMKEELISVTIGKEEIESEMKFLRDRIQTEEEQRNNVEESFNIEINALRFSLIYIYNFKFHTC